jgi:hypothetical protein|tara:strand:+ start:945 stop:1445 length:501 start_codon:yes stop_codon:yes gene_type:complete
LSEIVNKIALSGLITLDMKTFKGSQKRKVIDVKNWLFEGMVLKEKKFREHLKTEKWEDYKDTFVSLHCSNDTIIPVWAYMLLTKYLNPYASSIIYGNEKDLEKLIFTLNINDFDIKPLVNKRVLLKGCTDTYIPEDSYVQLSNKLIENVKSLMFGEACSNVPIFKS